MKPSIALSLMMAVPVALVAADSVQAHVIFEVNPPGVAQVVSYDIHFTTFEPTDSLSPCSYLIDWRAVAPTGDSIVGWVAYSDGHFWRYRPGKLQEYHVTDDLTPFMPHGFVSEGVQQRSQFVDLLPEMVVRKIASIQADSTYQASVFDNGNFTIVEGIQRIGGCDAQSFRYVIDSSTRLPVLIEIVANPGLPSEQTSSAKYSYEPSPVDVDLSEDGLRQRYSDAFTLFRRDNFSLQNLRGYKLPGFALATISRERYIHEQSEPFAMPTVIAILDSDVDSTPSAIAMMRQAVDVLPGATCLIFAFKGNDVDAIESIIGNLRPDEYALINADSLARDCGVVDTPSLIFCKADATVADVQIGFNKQLNEIVVQKAAMAR